MDAIKGSRLPLGLTFIGLMLTIFFLYMAIPKKWEDATKVGDDGSISLADDWARTIEKKKSKFEQHSLYMLLATQDGYFLCKHCPTGRFFLKKGELYRYGTTGDKKKGRGYNEEWLAKNLLTYIHLLTADLTTVKIEETTLIGTYAINPQNLSRPLSNSLKARPYWYRLVLPPGNNSLD